MVMWEKHCESAPEKSGVLCVNGFSQRAAYSPRETSAVLDALLDRIAQSCARAKRARFIVSLAGPPGSGKSTLALALCTRARARKLPFLAQALGLDGFHLPQAVLNAQTAVIGGERTPLCRVKGRPETFDCARYARFLALAAECPQAQWPVYDRVLHDMRGQTERVWGDVLIVEGNWLMLKRPEWREARAFADLCMMMDAPDWFLKPRLIARKTRGGKTREEAEDWYRRVDGPNCALYRAQSDIAPVRIRCMSNGLHLL